MTDVALQFNRIFLTFDTAAEDGDLTRSIRGRGGQTYRFFENLLPAQRQLPGFQNFDMALMKSFALPWEGQSFIAPTTNLYDRRSDDILPNEVERIVI